MQQTELFGEPRPLPAGFSYQTEFLSPAEESALLDILQALPLREARYKQCTANRRVVSYGRRYDYDQNELIPTGPVPDFLDPLRGRVAAWTGIAAADFTHALVAENRPGTQLGWHRDVPEFETVVRVSLGAACRMRLRPGPPRPGCDKAALALTIDPRSVYCLRGDARWALAACDLADEELPLLPHLPHTGRIDSAPQAVNPGAAALTSIRPQYEGREKRPSACPGHVVEPVELNWLTGTYHEICHGLRLFKHSLSMTGVGSVRCPWARMRMAP